MKRLIMVAVIAVTTVASCKSTKSVSNLNCPEPKFPSNLNTDSEHHNSSSEDALLQTAVAAFALNVATIPCREAVARNKQYEQSMEKFTVGIKTNED